ncbi:MAG: endonuclease/exonuclease/phosphatase family protein [Rubricoccaceae bacterium]
MSFGLRLTAAAASAGLLLAFALAYAGRYVHPREAWVLQLAALALPVLALGLVLSTFVWTVALVQQPAGRLAQSLLALHVAAWLALLIRYPPQGKVASALAEAREPADLVVLSANVGEPVEGADSVLQELLERYRPDVVALQETTVVVVDTLRGASGAAMTMLFAPEYALAAEDGFAPSASPEHFPQPVFATLPARSEPLVNFNLDADEWRGGRYRRVELSVNGVPVALYNVHLRSFAPLRPWRGARRPWLRLETWRNALAAYREDFTARADEAEQLAWRIEAETLPVLLVGDLNATADQWVYRRLARTGTDALAGQAGRSATFPAARPLVRIDHVIAGPGWSVIAALRERRGLSDHRPLVAQLRLLSLP